MRVLNVTGGISTNGIEQTIHRLEHYFSNSEIICGVFESKNPVFERKAAERGIETIFFGPNVTNRFESISLLPGRGYPKAAIDALQNVGTYDLIHVYGGPLFHGPIGVFYAALSGCPIITRFNGYEPLPESSIKRTVVRAIITGLLENTRIVFNSHAQKSDTLDAYGVKDKDHINVIPPGVDARYFKPISDIDEQASVIGVDSDTAIIGSVVTPRPVKRLDRAFEIISTVAETKDVIYVILGDSGRLEEYKQLAKEMGVADLVYWAGHKEQTELAQWYSLFDVTILTSEWESFGMSITESYLCGTPCIAFDVGGMSDQIVNDKTGRLVDPYDIDSFAAAIKTLLADETKRNSFGNKGEKYVRNRFTLDTVSKQYRELIASIT
jgi:glycosyltransferase involved in cell wall biosynthesis